MYTRETELFHHGVKGMKWGVRRAQKKWEKNVSRNWTKAHNKAADKINAKLDEFNANPKYKNAHATKNPKAYRKYAEDYCKMWNDIYTKELDSMFGKSPINTGRKWCETVPMFLEPADLYDGG